VERASAPHAGRIRGARGADPVPGAERNAHAERVVRPIKDECLNRVIPMGERHLRRTLHEFVEHDHRERHHQRLGNELINRPSSPRSDSGICRRPHLGGLLNYDYRAA
jgi:hypothetical protein